MNKRISLSSVLLLPLFLIPGCISPENQRSKKTSPPAPPSWVSSAHHKKFPEFLYLTGTGISPVSREKSDDRARQELAKQIRVRINGTDEVTISEKKEFKKGRSTSTAFSDVSSEIIVSVDQELDGVQIVDRWFDSEGGDFHSFAVLNREEAAAGLTKKIEKAAHLGNSLYEQGLSLRGEKNYVAALRSFIRGELTLQKSEQDRLARRVVAGKVYDDDIKMPERELIEAISELASGIRIREISPSGDKNTSEIIGQDSMLFGVFYKKATTQAPVSDAPLLITLDNGVQFKRRSGPDGLSHISLPRSDADSQAPEQITISLDIESIVSGIPNKYLKGRLAIFSDITGTFSYKPSGPEMMVLNKNVAFKSLASKLVSNISATSKTTEVMCTVGDFIEVISNNRLRFSRLIENELKTALTLTDKIRFKVQEGPNAGAGAGISKGGTTSAPYLVTGGYVINKKTIKISVKLVEQSTNIIVAAAETLLNRKDADEADFVVAGVGYPEAAFPNTVNALFPKKPAMSAFNIRIWTDKKVYIEGEPVIFHFTTDRDCYLTLLDLGTSGNISYLFPNEFQKDSFIKKDTVYSIPGKEYGFSIKAEAPPGIERVKAIASLKPLKINELNSKTGFFSIRPEDGKMARDLRMEVERLSNTNWVEGYYEFFIRAPEGLRYRGLTKENIPKPEKPIDIIGTQGVREEETN